MGYNSRSCKELDPTEHVTHSAPPGSPLLVGTCVLQLLLSATARAYTWESPHLEIYGSFYFLTPMANDWMIHGCTTGWPLCLKLGQFCCMIYAPEPCGSGLAACYLSPCPCSAFSLSLPWLPC